MATKAAARAAYAVSRHGDWETERQANLIEETMHLPALFDAIRCALEEYDALRPTITTATINKLRAAFKATEGE